MAFNSLNVVFKIGATKLPSSLTFNTLRAFSSVGTYKNILTDKKGEKQNIGVVTLNRPKVLNALNAELVREIIQAFQSMDEDPSIGAIVITGSEKAFAAGADIKEMENRTMAQNYREGFIENWADISKIRKPIIAAVNGFALGGGCELAMVCDIIYAGEKARFGQPEIIIGAIPGAGGTQRIARSCGKSKAMEMCLSGDHITAQDAEKMGLVSKIFPADKVVDEAIKLGEKITKNSPLLVRICKESVNTAFETTLQQGLLFERRAFYAAFGTEDRKEGMSAFVEKRKPNFKNN